MVFCKDCKHYRNQHLVLVDFADLDKLEVLKANYIIEAKTNKGHLFIRKNACTKVCTNIDYKDFYSDKSFKLYEKANILNKDNTCQCFKATTISKLINFIKIKVFKKWLIN